jgi:antitoxin HicB
MVNLNYPVQLKAAEDGSVTVTFPQVPEAITQGVDKGDALERAVDALEAALSFYIDAGTDLPKAGRGKRTVRRPRSAASSSRSTRRCASKGSGKAISRAVWAGTCRRSIGCSI